MTWSPFVKGVLAFPKKLPGVVTTKKSPTVTAKSVYKSLALESKSPVFASNPSTNFNADVKAV